ncbi:MAG: potassium-transporting ATPase subunit KdpA [Myxococcota bacterium]
MHASELYLLGVFFALLVTICPIVGSYFSYVFNRPIHPIEGLFYRATRVSVAPMNWKQYLSALLIFQGLGLLTLLIILQFNARGRIPIDLAINISTSFVTNTDWQAYAGESTLSYLSQTLGLTVQNFLSAATGFAVLLAFIRGLQRSETSELGNFWVDITRIIFCVLLPGAFILAITLVSQGAIQNFSEYIEAISVEGFKQILPMGPAASQTAIAVLGGNGGGFFGQNLTHPFVNPSELSNFVLMSAVLILPAALVYFYGLQTSKRQARVIICVMLGLFLLFYICCLFFHSKLGSLEGQEIRFKTIGTLLMNTLSTATSNGSVNAMLESLSPLTNGLMMLQIMLGEIIFGGVGSGLYGMLLFVLLTVFLSGLMIGRTPEYLGKKIEAPEMQLILVAILLPGIVTLTAAGITCLKLSGGHSLSQILYAFTSTTNNNGSALGGLDANTMYFNLALSITMLLGRFGTIVPVLMIAGIMARKRCLEPELRTFETDTLLFGVLLASVILLIGALTFLPGWFLGPLLEQVTLMGAQK